MSHPAGLPDLFIDRSLGRLRVPQGLRAAGQRVVTWPSTSPADEKVQDTTWPSGRMMASELSAVRGTLRYDTLNLGTQPGTDQRGSK